MFRRNIGTILENVLDICMNRLKLSILCSGKRIRFILLIFSCCQLLLFLSETGHRGNCFSIGELVQGLPRSFIEKNFRFMCLSKIPFVFCFHIRSKHFLVGKVLAGVMNELIDCFQPFFGCEECVVFLLLINLSGRKKCS